MDRLISEQEVLDVIASWFESVEQQRILQGRIKAIPSAEQRDSEDKIIRRTLENFMRGLWEEIQVGELEYTTSEVYEMLEREIFTDNHVATGYWEHIRCDMYECSECQHIYTDLSGEKQGMNFCPNCGTRMEIEQDG